MGFIGTVGPEAEPTAPQGPPIPELEKPPAGPGPPTKKLPLPLDQAREVYKTTYAFLDKLNAGFLLAGAGATLASVVVLILAIAQTIILWALVNVAEPVADTIVKFIDKARKELSPSVAAIAADVLNELTGADFTPEDLPTGKTFADQVERARRIGRQLQDVLITEFAPDGTIGPTQGRDAAARFTGFVTNFAVATALISIVSEIESLGAIEEFRELGVEVARNLGLGRLHRLALRPLIQTLVTTPLEWDLHKTYHPTLVSEADAVRAFHRGLISEGDMFEELERRGFSPERIRTLVELTQETLSIDDLELLTRYDVLTRGDAVARLTLKGFTPADGELALRAVDLRRVDSLARTWIDVLKRQRKDGVLNAEQFAASLEEIRITDEERRTIRVLTETEVELPRRFLTFAQMETALVEGVVDVDELSEFLVREGYSADDATILRILALLRLAEKEKGKKEREKRSSARAEKLKARGKKQAAPSP